MLNLDSVTMFRMFGVFVLTSLAVCLDFARGFRLLRRVAKLAGVKEALSQFIRERVSSIYDAAVGDLRQLSQIKSVRLLLFLFSFQVCYQLYCMFLS